MTQAEIAGTEVILTYWGFTFYNDDNENYPNGYWLKAPADNGAIAHIWPQDKVGNLCKSLDALSPVVKKVREGLTKCINDLTWYGRTERWQATMKRSEIFWAASELDVTKLFTAVVAAINFINDNNKDKSN